MEKLKLENDEECLKSCEFLDYDGAWVVSGAKYSKNLCFIKEFN